MTELMWTGIVFALLVVFVACTFLGLRSDVKQGPDVGLALVTPCAPCAVGVHYMLEATPLGDGRRLHECECRAHWWIESSVDEDINNPSVATIELALSRTTDPEGRDWLLDKWNAAKRRAS